VFIIFKSAITTMIYRTATFTSAQNRTMSGYQLVERSHTIDDLLARQLTRWSPSHNSLWHNSPATYSYNFYRCGHRDFGFSRTCYGGPEYSGRTGMNVFTRILVLSESEFSQFNYDATSVIKLAAASGAWHLNLANDFEAIDDCVMRPSLLGQGKTETDQHCSISLQLMQMLARDNQLAVLGCEDSLGLISSLYNRIDVNMRSEISFSTGLRPTKTRPFRLHFFNHMSESLKADIAREKMPVLNCQTCSPR
jgi:hypothetical protein